VLGDRGINAGVPEGYWKGVVETIVQGTREGRPAESLCQAVARVVDVLAEKLPARARNADEIKNVLVEGRRA